MWLRKRKLIRRFKLLSRKLHFQVFRNEENTFAILSNNSLNFLKLRPPTHNNQPNT